MEPAYLASVDADVIVYSKGYAAIFTEEGQKQILHNNL